jgi:hypothetical protein
MNRVDALLEFLNRVAELKLDILQVHASYSSKSLISASVTFGAIRCTFGSALPMQYLTPFPGFRKTQILSRRKEELRHALKHNATPDKAAKAAKRVRVAKLHLIKALQSALAEQKLADPSITDQIENLHRESDHWERISTDEIIERYNVKRA